MRFRAAAKLALWNLPSEDRFDVAVGAIEEAIRRGERSVSAAHVRVAAMQFERMLLFFSI